MIIQTYEYKKLSRSNEDGSRKYLTPDGSKVSSVTTILDRTKPQEAVQALNRWRNSIGHVNAAQITAMASGTGTKMHSYLEHYIETSELRVPGSHPLAIQSNKMAKVIIDNGLKYLDIAWGSEISLYYEGLYAGTTDVVGIYKGKPAIIDFKQTNKLKTEERVVDYRLQLCAYISAHNKMFGTDIKQGIIMMCSKDLVYQQFEVNETNINYYSDLWWDRVAAFYGV